MSGVCVFVCRNVCSTVKLGCCLNLKLIALNTWNVEHKPKVQTLYNRTQKMTQILSNEVFSNTILILGGISITCVTCKSSLEV